MGGRRFEYLLAHRIYCQKFHEFSQSLHVMLGSCLKLGSDGSFKIIFTAFLAFDAEIFNKSLNIYIRIHVMFHIQLFSENIIYYCLSQWPRGLKNGSAASCLLGLWVRIPPGSWMYIYLSLVGVVCYQVEVSATG